LEWLRQIISRPKQSQQSESTSEKLSLEIWQAHRDLKIAELKLNEALDPDQIDYAIFITEAAEKRLNMLIREARKQNLDLSDERIPLQELRKNTLDM